MFVAECKFRTDRYDSITNIMIRISKFSTNIGIIDINHLAAQCRFITSRIKLKSANNKVIFLDHSAVTAIGWARGAIRMNISRRAVKTFHGDGRTKF